MTELCPHAEVPHGLCPTTSCNSRWCCRNEDIVRRGEMEWILDHDLSCVSNSGKTCPLRHYDHASISFQCSKCNKTKQHRCSESLAHDIPGCLERTPACRWVCSQCGSTPGCAVFFGKTHLICNELCMLSHDSPAGVDSFTPYLDISQENCQRCRQKTWFARRTGSRRRSCIYCKKHKRFLKSRLLLVSGIDEEREMELREDDGRAEHEEAALSTYAYPGFFLRIEYERLLRTHDGGYCTGEDYDHEERNIHLLDLPLSRLVGPDDFYAGPGGWHLLEEKLEELYHFNVKPPCVRNGGTGYCQARDEWTPQTAYLINEQGKAVSSLLCLLSDEQRRNGLYTALTWAFRKENNQLARFDRHVFGHIIGLLPYRED